MAASLPPVTYEQLTDLEADFDDSNVELLRMQVRHERALYEQRNALVSRIPGFWSQVLEAAPPEIAEYVQPMDSNVLFTHIERIDVVRFEVEDPWPDMDDTGQPDAAGTTVAAGSPPGPSPRDGDGDPRSFAIRFTFSPNDYFEDRVLEKRFWYRKQLPMDPAAAVSSANTSSTACAIWGGLVSKPVPIRWKPGKDLTGGLLGLAVDVWAEREATLASGMVEMGATGPPGPIRNPASAATTPLEQRLAGALERTAIGGLSFFAWFGFVGRPISANESEEAIQQDRAQRAARAKSRAAGLIDMEWDEPPPASASAPPAGDDDAGEDVDADEDGDEDIDDYIFEIFQDGDDIALAFAEDLWPNAIKYFRECRERRAADSDDGANGVDNSDDDM